MTIAPPRVSAEQASAETYRHLISSGKFYLEYTPDGDYTKRKADFRTLGFAVDGAQKMMYSATFGITSAAAYIPLVGGLFGGTGFTLNRNYYYDGENYYSIISKKEVIKSTPAQLQDQYINPLDAVAFNSIDNGSRILDTFGMFNGDSSISFIDSGQRFVDDKNKLSLKYDKYVKNLQNSEWQTFFYVYYNDKDELVGIDKITVEKNTDVESQMNPQNNEVIHTVVIKLTENLPKDAFTLPENAQIYEPWLGDMNELIEQRVPAEN